MDYPLPDPSKSFDEQDLVTLLAMCVFGEARNQTDQAMLGVGCVIANRVASGNFGQGFAGVILKPWQFSCFNAKDLNHDKLLKPLQYESQEIWERCYRIAETILHEKPADVTGGALYYFSKPLKRPPTAWGSVEHTVTLGDLLFYRRARG